MRRSILKLLAQQTFDHTLKSTSSKWLILLFNSLFIFALLAAYTDLTQHQKTVEHYRQEVRERWENNPDKHPHRMAHYGYLAFRQKSPLSFFDYGMDSYLGNAVFLEAHRQNTINFSEASLSNGLLRFGEISAALLLTLLVPLLLFFWGFALLAGEREQGTLRLLLAQGINWSELILGRTLGLFYLSLTLFLPAMLLTFLLLLFSTSMLSITGIFLSYVMLFFVYLVYLFVISLLAVWISAISATSKAALVQLIACWLAFTLLLPKLSQLAGQAFFPSPSKIAFDTAIDHELIQHGDSHDPDDPYFNALKDSLLTTYQVKTTKELPFNYGGFVMREGEKISTEIFRRHQAQLMEQYQLQQAMVRWTAFLNPYIAIKKLSMAFSGTDFLAYRHFQDQAEHYRYQLAQGMNNLQIEHVSNHAKGSSDKRAAISHQHWLDFPDFEQNFLSFTQIVRHEIVSILGLCSWLVVLLGFTFFRTKSLKAF
ncbi:MAG: DUF3526 domain-containing protein [Bacteroidota bacterium]